MRGLFNENITKEQVIGNYSVSNASLVYDKGTSIFKITITNITNSPLNINDFKITFKSESGSVITVLNGFSIDNISYSYFNYSYFCIKAKTR